jgi:hypothetical protein
MTNIHQEKSIQSQQKTMTDDILNTREMKCARSNLHMLGPYMASCFFNKFSDNEMVSTYFSTKLNFDPVAVAAHMYRSGSSFAQPAKKVLTQSCISECTEIMTTMAASIPSQRLSPSHPHLHEDDEDRPDALHHSSCRDSAKSTNLSGQL